MEWMIGVVRRVGRLQLPLYAANVCYFLVLSLFPGLLLVLAGLRYTSLSATDLIRFLEGMVPSALMGAVEKLIVTVYYNASGALVSVSAAAALWSASRGIYGLMAGLNRVCGVREDRSWLRTRLLSAGYMLFLPGLLTVTLLVHVFGGQLIVWVENSTVPAARVLAQMVDLRLVVLLAVQTLGFALMYTALPNRPGKFLRNLPGAAGAALGWQVFSKLFSLYVVRMDGYAMIYGEVFAMALGMLWLYCCSLILLFGAVLNRLLEEKGQ